MDAEHIYGVVFFFPNLDFYHHNDRNLVCLLHLCITSTYHNTWNICDELLNKPNKPQCPYWQQKVMFDGRLVDNKNLKASKHVEIS